MATEGHIAPLPDVQTCSLCGYLALGYWRDGGLFLCGECKDAGHASHAADDDDARPEAPACPLCGEGVWPANAQTDTGVAWGHHHAHALCALENPAARVAALEGVVTAIQLER